MRFRVWGIRLRVWSRGCEIKGMRFRVWGLCVGYRVITRVG